MPRDRSRPPSDRSRSPGARSGGPRRPGGPGGSKGGDGPRKPRFGDGPKGDRPVRAARDDRPARATRDDRPARGPGGDDRPKRGTRDDRPRKPGGKSFGGKSFEGKPRGERRFDDRPRPDRDERPERAFGDRPPRREGSDFRKPRDRDERGERTFGDRPPRADRPFGDRPARRDDRAPGDRDRAPRGERRFDDRGPPRREGGEFRKPRDGGDFRKPRSRFDDDKPRSRFEERPARGPRFEEPAIDAAPKRPKLGVAPTHLLYGLHAVRAALKNDQRTLKALYVTEAGLEALIGDDAIELTLEPELVEKEELDRLAPTGAVHQGALLVADPLPEVGIEDVIAGTADAEDVILVLLDQITDPQNVGAIMRSAAAFGAVAVIEHRRHGPEVTATVAKAASGAVELVPLVQVTNLARAIDDLKEAGFTCIGLAEEAEQPIGALDLKGKLALVIGAEGEGMRRLTIEKCNAVAVLPTAEDFSTLNASASAAIALYEARRQRS